MYAYATGGSIGDITDQYEHNVNISGSSVDLGSLTWSPKKYSHLLWQIGTADRKASEFNLGNVPRAYGLFQKVPANLDYTIGQSTPSNDWYYAQTHTGSWNIHFNLNQTYSGAAHLTVAMAGQTRTPFIEVHINGLNAGKLQGFNNDAAIYRSTNKSGYYHLVVLSFPASNLKSGANTLVFKALSVKSGGGIMYDTVKLEVE